MTRDKGPFKGKPGSSESVEEYLETLWRMQGTGEKITTTGIASVLGVSPASVSEMLARLEKDGYVRRVPYRGAELTAKGRSAGRKILGRHRLIERFLEGMGLPRRKIHREACRLEHHVSGDLEGAMRRSLGRPGGRKGLVSLVELGVGETGKVVSAGGGGRAARRLEDMGLTPGAPVRVMRAAPFSGPVEVCIRDSCLVIGRGMAAKVMVEVGA